MKTTMLVSACSIVAAAAAAIAWAHSEEQFEGPWQIDKVAVDSENEFAGLKKNDTIEGRPEWWGEGEMDFDVKDSWTHPFQAFTFHRVERDSAAPPSCAEVTTMDVQLLLSKPYNVLIGTGNHDHDHVQSGDHSHVDAHLMIFIPCAGIDGPEFRMIIRSFSTTSGGGTVTHNGIIHGSGKS